MEYIKKNKFLILFVILLCFLTFIMYFNDKEPNSYYEDSENISLKHYKENEYIPVNITYDQMARIYLQDYVYKLIFYPEEAYSLLDSNYREVKFPTFEDFNNYVDSIFSVKLQEMKVVKYSVTDTKDYRDFDVYDSANNLFIFRENGVMQYTVLFDRWSV